MTRPIVKYLDPVSGGYEFATVVDIGDLRNLNTTIKSDIVGAINSIISDGVHNPINDEKIEDLERIINSLKDGTFNIEDFGSIDEYLKQQFLDELDKINEKNREEIQSVLTQLDTSVDDAIKDYQEKVAAQNIILENAENTLADARGTLEAKAAELETANIGFSELKTEFDELDGYISTNVRTIDFDNFNAMVEDYESVVTQTSDEVGVDMSGSTLSYLTGRVADAEANISVQADEITSKMGYDEFQYMPVPKYDYGENLLFDTFDFGNAWNGKNGAQVTTDTFLFGKVVAFNSPTGLYETLTDDLTIGESYVFSTYVNVQPSEKSPSQDRYEPISKSYDPTDFKIQIGGKSFNPGVYEDLSGINGWVRINQEFVADAVNPIISITPTGVNSQSEVAYMAMPKVEKGLTVTPWQPHVEDNYATISSTQSMIKQQANSITAFVTGVEELDDSYKQATSTFKMLADGFEANTEAVEAYEDAVTRYGTEYSNINGKFEQKVWKDDFDAIIEDINIDNRNRVLNSDFIRSEISSSDRRLIVEDWSLNSDWEIKTIDNDEYLSRNRTGLTQNLITSASSSYFPVRDGERILFGFDLIHSGLDNDKVFAIELFDINNKRLLKEEFSLSSLTKVGNRYHGSFSISTPGAEKGSVVLQLPRNGSVSFTKISFQNADIGSVDWSPAPEDSWIIQSKLATYISQVEDEITIGGTGQKIDTLTGLLTEDKGTFTLNPDKIATEVLNSQTYDDMGFVNKTNFEQTADGWMQEITSEGRLAGYINASPDTYRISFDKIMLEGTTWADALGSSKITVTENFALMGQNGRPVLDVNNDGSINMNVTSLKIGEYNALTTDDKSDIESEVADKVIKTTEPYVHIAYADTEDGQGLSFNPSGKQYIGFAKSYLPTPSGTASNYTWSKYVGADGYEGADGVGIKSTTVRYASSTSGTSQPSTGWSSTIPTVEPGNYLWTEIVWTYTNNEKKQSYTVARIGADGVDGKDGYTPIKGVDYFDGTDGISITKVKEYYLTSDKDAGITITGYDWKETIQPISETKPYLWNYERIEYSNGLSDTFGPNIIGRYATDGEKGEAGRGIASITEYYLASPDNSGVIVRGNKDWSTTFQQTTPTNRYLWNYEEITYTDGLTDIIGPSIIGTHGMKGDSPIVAYLTNDSHMIPTDEDGLNQNYENAYTEMHIMDGIEDDTDSYKFSAEESSGIVGKIEGNKYTVTSLSGDLAEVKITATKGSFAISKIFTVTKSKQGIKGQDGQDSLIYQLETDSLVLTRDVDSTLNPRSINIQAVSMKGNDPKKPFAGYFRVYEQHTATLIPDDFTRLALEAGVSEEEYILSLYDEPRIIRYESIFKESTLKYEPRTDAISVYIQLYADGSFSEVLDSQTVMIVSHGKDGEQGPRGLQGLEGPQGKQGIEGEKGTDGKSSYTHIAYATGDQGQTFSHDTFSEATHIGIYVSDDQDSSDNWKDYKWTLIKGANGAQGLEGPKGDDGRTPYFHTAWANSADGKSGFSTTVSAGKLYLGTVTTFEKDDPTDYTKYSWTLIKGEKGDTGEQGPRGLTGAQGPKGDQGIEGKKGANGKPSYTHIAYADTITGVGFSHSDASKPFIGIYADDSPTSSDTASKYTWSKWHGEDGPEGVQGPKGADGKPSYTHFAYANNATGTVGFSTSDSLNKTYLGIYTDNTKTDSKDPDKYTWTLIKGATGATGPRGVQGLQGPQGKQGIKGADGADGKSSYTHIAYATGNQGQSFNHSTFDGATYVGMYVSDSQDSSDNWADYEWTLIKGRDGSQGVRGPQGPNGKIHYFHIAYANNSTGTSGFSVNDSANKLYIGTYTDFEPDDSKDPSKYSWTLVKGEKGETGSRGPQGVEGPKGDDGVTTYTWIRYADTPTSGMNNSPVGKTYIGFAYNRATADESENYSDYTWSKFVGDNGEKGVPGDKGDDGKTTYTWIRYSANATGVGMVPTPTTNTKYIGIAVNKTSQTPSTIPTDYTWSKYIGEKGEDGSDAIVAVLTNESHVIPTDEDGKDGNYRGANTEIKILEGATDITSTFKITASASDGVTGSLSSNKYTVTKIADNTDTGEVTLTAKKGSTTITKVFTITKSKKGIKGTDGDKGDDSILYQLNTDTLVVIKDIDDVYSQDSVSLTSVMKVGSEDYTNNPVYFRIYEQKVNPLTVDTFSELSMKDQVDNREYILSLYGKPRLLQYESFMKESHIDYNLGKDIMSIFVEIYEDENFTKIIDSQSIAVIAEPKPNYKLEMHSTNGNGFLNGVINTEMYVTLYRGEDDITDSTDAKHFIWTRVSSDTNSDTAWNNKYKAGAKSITVTKDDVNVRARFSCNFVK